jgi:hypothetical protein
VLCISFCLNIHTQLTAHGSYLELPLPTLNITGKLQACLAWGIQSLSAAGQHRLADDATCSRWMQHAGIQTSGGLAVSQVTLGVHD